MGCVQKLRLHMAAIARNFFVLPFFEAKVFDVCNLLMLLVYATSSEHIFA